MRIRTGRGKSRRRTAGKGRKESGCPKLFDRALNLTIVQAFLCAGLLGTAAFVKMKEPEKFETIGNWCISAMEGLEARAVPAVLLQSSRLELEKYFDSLDLQSETGAKSPPQSEEKPEIGNYYRWTEPKPDNTLNSLPFYPVIGTISSAYGERESPFDGTSELHTGIDIAAEEGEPICAVFGGTVIEAGTDSARGNYLRIRHPNGLESLYCHCSMLLAEQGDKVEAGEAVAKVGSTGNATGPHLHLELFRNGERIDPAEVLG